MKAYFRLSLSLAALLVGCSTESSGIGSALGQLNSEGPINGYWRNTTMFCGGTDVTSLMEEVTLTVNGEKVSFSTTFDNGTGALCTVRTPATAAYTENNVTFTFGDSTCTADCPPLTCVSGAGRTPPAPMTLNFALAEPNLTLTSSNDSVFGCASPKELELNFIRD